MNPRRSCHSSMAWIGITSLVGVIVSHVDPRRLRTAASTAVRTIAVAIALALPAGAQATDPMAEAAHGAVDRGNWSMIRFDFDNDKPLGSDDAYSAGWSLQAHSTPRDRWGGPLGSLLAKLPGMGDDGDGGRAAQRSFGITQLILTPPDLTIETFQPEEAPYAGILGIHGSWASYDNRRLVGLQLYGGCLGPCSQGEQVQRFVHEDLGLGDPPKGWDNQLDERWLGNANLGWRYKLLAAANERYQARRWANDFSVGGQLALGNAARFVEGQLEYRVGWGLPMGFTHIPDPAPRGVVLDPVYLPVDTPVATSRPWRGYLSVVVRAAAVDELIIVDSARTVAGVHYPGFGGIAIGEDPELLVGLHVGRGGYAVHLTYYRFLGGAEQQGSASDTDWVGLSFERRF